MKKILGMIEAELKSAFTACGYEEKFGKAVLSNRPDLCEYQCNGAMAAAKAYKKKPIDIAGDVVAKLREGRMFSLCDAVMPGFINLKLDGGFVAEYLNQMAADQRLGLETQEKPLTIIVDYGGANVAKPLHVGHLRSAVIGESIKRMGRALGHNMIGDVHLGDWGLQMGLIIEELRDRKSELPYFDESFAGEYPEEAPFTISELEDIYPTASKKAKFKADEAREQGMSQEEIAAKEAASRAFAERAHLATRKLQEGYPPFTAIWNHIMNVSKADLKKNYGNLNVSFDLWKGESDAQKYIPDLIQNLIDQGLAYESQGALVVDIGEPADSKELPPCIVRKSDGAALYATSDLGTIIEREKDFHPDAYIYIADKRQELHFTQVFRVAKKAGFVAPDQSMSFLGFGTMNGKDGKPFKTRDGGVMRLEHLISDIDQAVYQRIMENRTVSEEEAKETAKTVGLAALKYGDLSNQAAKDYIFDIDRFISFEGNTGPYILYTIVRIKSILSKYKDQQGSRENLAILPAVSEAEKDLMLEIAKYNDVLETAFAEKAPHKICQYIYDLSNDFNRFYHDTKILSEEDKKQQASWIGLITLAKDVLSACIQVLGFEAPERM
ncbi:MAG: arginine--tRNA ligase [Lachnospiraceae bacterium]|nr:arginine--tRNA ligase [Lachnospiraceae bacterium]